MRRPLVVGNWKMNGSRTDNAALVQAIISASEQELITELAVCPPYVYLDQVVQSLANHCVSVGAQDVSVHLNGAYTAEVSASMLLDLGCRYVIVGHSERRQYHHEGSLLVAQKTMAALKAGLEPIVCVGETFEQRESGATLDVIAEQLSAVKTVVGDEISRCVVAYEPVWAIGTGLTASPEQAQEVHRFIREQLGAAADDVSVLYGGSVKPANAASLFEQPDIDGALVGGAALNASDFLSIAAAYA